MMAGIWKPKDEDKLGEAFQFAEIESDHLEMSCKKVLVHGTTQSGATIRGLLTSNTIFANDKHENPEEDAEINGIEQKRWTIDGVIIDDACIEPFQMSYIDVNGLTYLDQGNLCSCINKVMYQASVCFNWH